ncbi:MAG: YdiU family protein, partial [Candidatus Eremiobacteraeota bacterium]|nr:YdiU family protein [Candidatus Eremiobacteraeota bacterium]
LEEFAPAYRSAYLSALRGKLGLQTAFDDDITLLGDLLDAMAADRADHTRTWRALSTVTTESNGTFTDEFTNRERIVAWIGRYRERLARENSNDVERAGRQDAVNPKYVLRNYLAQVAIEAAKRKDFSEVARLLAVLRCPYDEQPENESYAARPPDWAKHIAVSCSS